MNYMLLLSKKKKASQLTCLLVVVVSCITNGSCRPTHIGAKLSYERMAADAIWMPQYSKIQKSAIWGNPSIHIVNINFLFMYHFQSTIPTYSTKYLSTTYLSINMELECTTKMIIIALCIWGGFVP